jgi:hypothetical protein
MVRVVVTTDGAASVVRGNGAAAGDFEMLITRADAAAGALSDGLPVSGSLRGIIVNTSFPLTPAGGSPYDARATVAGSSPTGGATIDGSIQNGNTIGGGHVTGAITLTNAKGNSIACASGNVTWSLSRVVR